MSSLYERARRYGLDENLESLIQSIERWRVNPQRTSAVCIAFDELVEAVEKCDSLGGHEDGEPMWYSGRSDGLG